MTQPVEKVCQVCNSRYFIELGAAPKFCPFCGAAFEVSSASTAGLSLEKTALENVTLVHGHTPATEEVQFSIGPYQIMHRIGQGGMGEVFLAYDTTCGRRIALKRIRTDLLEHKQLFKRFLKEARITSQLTHPAIIPIYAIHEQADLLYYTMPYVEGETLKQIIRRTRLQEKKGEKLDPFGGSIPSLIRSLISICQAVAYAHSKHVLHRDLKPENIIVGKFGQILILDWGLANMLHGTDHDAKDMPEEEETSLHGLTRFGKVVGTVAYMSPERATGHPATIQGDIYALGVILYQMLTLRLPFRRGSLQEFRKTMHEEVYADPAEIAPYRDVPKVLAEICKKCLAPVEQRYQTVEELLHDLESYIEGRSEWFLSAQLQVDRKTDWQFQENVLIAEHMAITRGMETADWVSLMISRASFTEHIKIEARIKLHEQSHGIGFLLSIPEEEERRNLNDGYCLWIGAEGYKSTKLLRSTVEVLHASDVSIKTETWYAVKIEKIDNNLHFYLNQQLQFSYVSHLPLAGTHIGLLSRDAEFEIENFDVYTGSPSVMVNCLAVPDAFLAHKNYAAALSEYRRIGYSFKGRAEGREGLFRAGVTLLEQAKDAEDPKIAQEFFELALLEFEKLHNTPGAPLEYLGKGLVYQTLHEFEEEIKCYTLAYRRYPQHPLLKVVQEQILYRLHEASRHHRKATYNLLYLMVRHLPQMLESSNVQKIVASLKKHWEKLSFFEPEPKQEIAEYRNAEFAVQLAFWLAKPYFIEEILQQLQRFKEPPAILIGNALFALMELGSEQYAANQIAELQAQWQGQSALLDARLADFAPVLVSLQKGLAAGIDAFFITQHTSLDISNYRILCWLFERSLIDKNEMAAKHIHDSLNRLHLTEEQQSKLDYYRVWFYLITRNWSGAETIFDKYPLEILTSETNPLFFFYGIWLQVTENQEIAAAHFSGIFDVAYPRSWVVGAHYLNGKMGREGKWLAKAFRWERRQLYRQLTLFYTCIGDEPQAQKNQLLEQKEYVAIE